MLKITIEVIPWGDYNHRSTIEEVFIANVGGDRDIANYECWFNYDPSVVKKEERKDADIEIKDYKRSKGSVQLLRQALNKYFTGSKNSKN